MYTAVALVLVIGASEPEEKFDARGPHPTLAQCEARLAEFRRIVDAHPAGRFVSGRCVRIGSRA